MADRQFSLSLLSALGSALDLSELRAIFQRPGGKHALSDGQLASLFEEFDSNGDGDITRREYFGWMGHTD